jgi:catechol 2,3-dioxygenase-like lactoylglutathione lyase family enzyme
VHPNGARGVASLALAVKDLDASLAHYRALLGEAQAANVSAPFVQPGTGARVGTVTLGRSTLVLTQAGPLPGTAGHAASTQLGTRGEGPYALVLATDGATPAPPTADRTHGAVIEFAAA